MSGESKFDSSSSAILTIPNAISAARILLIPAYVGLILGEGTEPIGIVLFVLVAATDWVDGTVARRTGRVTELGKILDPLADRLAIGAGLIALVIDGSFPLWAALLILVRDAAVLIVGTAALVWRRLRLDVRFIGKLATFGLMVAVPSIAWGNNDLPLARVATALGWFTFAIAIGGYYLATGFYVLDLRRALSDPSESRLGRDGDRRTGGG